MDTSRHNSWFNPHQFEHIPVTIIGAGATGSRVYEALVNLGLTNICVWDHDDVEAHNLCNQLYTEKDVGTSKVKGLQRWSRKKFGTTVGYMRARKVEGDQRKRIDGVVFLLTDTMESRREIFENSLKNNRRVLSVIETRMALTHGDVMQFNPNSKREWSAWESTLIDDDDAEASACGTALSVGTTASIIANLAVNNFIHYLLEPEHIDTKISVFLSPMIVSAGRLDA